MSNDLDPETRGAANVIRAALESLSPTQRTNAIAAALSALGVDGMRADIDLALAKTGNNITAAAKLLHCSRRALFNRMRELNMPLGVDGPKRKLVPSPLAP